MIGYYVHHVGRGHLHRATLVAQSLRIPVTGLSSLPRPAAWPGSWVQLPRDDEASDPRDVDARGRLHWVPEHDVGLRGRMAEISEWIGHLHPRLMVVDVSVEVALLARLHGVPVVSMVLPGDRRDPAHDLVHGIARRLLAAWPAGVGPMVTGLPLDDPRLQEVGAMSRFDHLIPQARTRAPGRRVVVLMGAGGSDVSAEQLAAAREATPDWSWTVLGGEHDAWVEDPWQHLVDADVVVTHAGQNALAEVAASRTPAVVVPQDRPHREQDSTAAVLARGSRLPAVVVGRFPSEGWNDLLEQARLLDGEAWSAWNDGGAAARAAAVIEDEHDRADAS